MSEQLFPSGAVNHQSQCTCTPDGLCVSIVVCVCVCVCVHVCMCSPTFTARLWLTPQCCNIRLVI